MIKGDLAHYLQSSESHVSMARGRSRVKGQEQEMEVTQVESTTRDKPEGESCVDKSGEYSMLLPLLYILIQRGSHDSTAWSVHNRNVLEGANNSTIMIMA